MVGISVGVEVGWRDGSRVGVVEGLRVGVVLGVSVGFFVGDATHTQFFLCSCENRHKRVRHGSTLPAPAVPADVHDKLKSLMLHPGEGLNRSNPSPSGAVTMNRVRHSHKRISGVGAGVTSKIVICAILSFMLFDQPVTGM